MENQENVTNVTENVVEQPTEEVVECDNEDRISDTLSDMYGWCVESYSID